MSKFSIINVLLLLGFSVVTSFSQATSATPAPASTNEDRNRLKNNRPDLFEQSRNRSDAQNVFVRRGSFALKKRISRSQRKILEPNTSDWTEHAAFLQNPETGLFKIFPDLGCEDNANVLRADEVCLNQIPMSAFYSFREKEHTTDFLSDIRLKNDYLISDGLLTQGIFVELGDLPLETVSMNTGGIRVLSEFKPEEHSEEILKQTIQLMKGVKTGGFLYRKSVPARENTTYALRVIAYRASLFRLIRGFPFNVLEGDDRVDIIVAFRLLKKDAADSHLTILWKELTRQKAPKAIFPKKIKRKLLND